MPDKPKNDLEERTSRFAREVRSFVRKVPKNVISLEDAKTRFAQNDLQLAKKQRTWFKRNKSIQWVANIDQAKALVQNFLSKASSPA